MFESLPQTFRQHGVPSDVRTLLLLRRSMEKGLVNTLGDVYVVLRSIVVKDQKMIGPFSKAYYDYFLNVGIEYGESLEDAILRSDTFQKWKEAFVQEDNQRLQWTDTELVNRFLDEVHLTSYDIQNILSGRDILDQDDPHLKDDGGGRSGHRERILDTAADYNDIDIKELLKRMEEVAKNQRDTHEGGSHWLGTGGISPYGHGGAAKGGIRVGGAGGGKMARKVIDNPRYFPVDMDEAIRDDNIDAALASLKGVTEESAQKEIDIDNTLKEGLRRGGLFLPEEKDILSNKMQVLLLIDNGGYSMDPHIGRVMKLFKKMKVRFAHELKVFYFHNTIYECVFSDERRSKPVSMDALLGHDPDYKVFVIGDAAMAPYELSRQSIYHWTLLKEKFSKMAWLNPDPQKYWPHTMTTQVLKEIFPMYPLTPQGIEDAVLEMNRKKDKKPRL